MESRKALKGLCLVSGTHFTGKPFNWPACEKPWVRRPSIKPDKTYQLSYRASASLNLTQCFESRYSGKKLLEHITVPPSMKDSSLGILQPAVSGTEERHVDSLCRHIRCTPACMGGHTGLPGKGTHTRFKADDRPQVNSGVRPLTMKPSPFLLSPITGSHTAGTEHLVSNSCGFQPQIYTLSVFSFTLLFGTGSQCVAQDILRHTIFLPQPSM